MNYNYDYKRWIFEHHFQVSSIMNLERNIIFSIINYNTNILLYKRFLHPLISWSFVITLLNSNTPWRSVGDSENL